MGGGDPLSRMRAALFAFTANRFTPAPYLVAHRPPPDLPPYARAMSVKMGELPRPSLRV
jgi:hypothetical protein